MSKNSKVWSSIDGSGGGRKIERASAITGMRITLQIYSLYVFDGITGIDSGISKDIRRARHSGTNGIHASSHPIVQVVVVVVLDALE